MQVSNSKIRLINWSNKNRSGVSEYTQKTKKLKGSKKKRETILLGFVSNSRI